MSFAILKEEDDKGEILDGTVYERWGRVFCSLNAHSLMTQKQRRAVIHFDIARLPPKSKVAQLLAVPLDVSDCLNDIHHTAGFLYGTYSCRFR